MRVVLDLARLGARLARHVARGGGRAVPAHPPLAGYERSAALALARRAGFDALGGLVVWRLDPA